MQVETFAFDPYSPAFQADPFPDYEVLRRDHPVFRHPEHGFWVLSRYDDVRRAMTDHETFTSGEGIVLGQDTQSFPPILTSIDPPQHTRMRKASQPAFAPRQVAAMEERIRAKVVGFLDALGDRTEVDLVHDFCGQIPITVIADLCGIPSEDLAWFYGSLGAAVADGLDSDAGRQAFGQIAEYFDRLVDKRYADPGDDLTSAMAHATFNGELLPKLERVGLAMIMFIGGIEATTFHLSNAGALLGTFPDAQQALAADPALIPSAMEEVLRFDSPVQADLRGVARDVEFDGTMIEAGSTVMLLIGAANRDPAEFPDPDRFDIRRDPNPHLAFMLGIHFCIGAGLARLESRVAFEELLSRYSFRLVDPTIARTFTNKSVMRGVPSLPVELTRGS